jgi:Tfp pilus assembly protein PilF
VLLLKNDFAGAESRFRTALEIKPKQVEALLGSAQALAAQGRNAESVEQLRAALQLKPDNEMTRIASGFSPRWASVYQDRLAGATLR